MSQNSYPDAGRELDALVAERVFGLVRCQGKKHDASYPNTYCYALPDSPADGGEVRCYSTNPDAANEVIERLRGEFTVTLVLPVGKTSEWSCEFKRPHPTRRHYEYHYVVAPTVPHAICLAALKAVARVRVGEPYLP